MDLLSEPIPRKQQIAKDAYLLTEFALPIQEALLADLQQIITLAHFRHMVTPSGFSMSVAMSNCGDFGWVTDKTGYRYTSHDPISGIPWPAMPGTFLQLAKDAAIEAGFEDFVPDACLINQYKVGARMSLHQDKNERDFSQPIVSVSLGLPAMFQFGGYMRPDKTIKISLNHGEVLVWGGESRLHYHGILPLKSGTHTLLGERRINLTFRKAA